MAIYGKKYTLEFDDVIEGEFNDYRLEIFKKYETENLSTADNVYVSAYNLDQGLLYQGTPVYIEAGVIYRSKANDPTSMPATGVIYADMPQSSGGNVLIKGVMAYSKSYSNDTYYVGDTGGLTLIEPSGVVQEIGYQAGYTHFILFDEDVTLKGTGTPIKLTYNLTDDDILSPFRSSYLDISFYKESLSDDFSELFAAESNAFKVYLYKNDSLFWQGWIGTQLFSEPFASPPYSITLRAYDGLNLLKDIPYFNDVEVFQATSNLFNDRYGYHNIVDVVEKCIYNTGVLGDIYYCVNIENSEYVEYSRFFVNRTRVHHQTFLKGESNSMNMEEVLEMVLRSLGATIYQRDGDWCFIKVSDFTLTSTPSILKRSVWRADTVPTATNYITTIEGTGSTSKVSNNVNFFQIDNSSTMTIQYPLKEVTIEQEFDHNMVTETTIDSVRDLGADDPSGTYLFTEWEPIGSNIQEAVVLRKNEVLGVSRELPKSFIEVDLSADSLVVDYCDPSLSYPVSHECNIDSSKITGVKAEAKVRPLGRNLINKEAISVMFSPKLSYTSGGVLSETGFGRSSNYETGMIDGRIFRIYQQGMERPPLFTTLYLIMYPDQGIPTPQDRFKLQITKNKQAWWTSYEMTVGGSAGVSPTFLFGDSVEAFPPTFSTPYLSFYINEVADYELTFIATNGTPKVFSYQFMIKGFNEYNDYLNHIYVNTWTSRELVAGEGAEPTNFYFSETNGDPRGGGNFGTPEPSVGLNNTVADVFTKSFDCVNTNGLASIIKYSNINNWTDVSITATENWQNNISNLKVNMNIFGSAKMWDTNGDPISDDPLVYPYTNTYDVSYTGIKLLPLISDYAFAPKKQEYILTQSGSFSSKLTKKVKIGSGLFNVGSKRYITFNSETGSSAMKSWDTFKDARGSSGYGVEDSTMQHLVGACYMELYRVSVRRLDGTHYGNYKYGDKLQPIVGGSVETLNGSTGKFFPMNVVMDLRNARVSFSGDDLMDNTGTTWQSTLTKSIKWIGDNGITETETLT
jgi:hypothetical protein